MIGEARQNSCASLGILLGCSVAFGAGFWINMAVALEEGTGVPLLAMFLLVLAPVPMILCCRSPTRDMPEHLMDDDDASRNTFRDFGLLAFGFALTLAFGVLAVALRQYRLTSQGFLGATGGACVTGTISFAMAKCAVKGNRL